MGWASGSTLFEKIISASKKRIPDKKIRKEFYVDIIEAFEEADWDTQDECFGSDSAFDKAIKELHPDWDM